MAKIHLLLMITITSLLAKFCLNELNIEQTTSKGKCIFMISDSQAINFRHFTSAIANKT
jgi:hypothetical protein